MSASVRKYLEIIKLYVKAQLSWRSNIMSDVLFGVIKILFALIVWGAVFDGKDEVAGFTLSSMLTYYLVSSFFSQLESINNTSWTMRHDVLSGTFSKYMVIPIRPGQYFLARSLGIALVSSVFVLGASVLWAVVFQIPLSFSSDPKMILCALLMEGLGLVFVEQIGFFLGLLSFKFMEIDTFLMIKGNLVSFLTGAIVPLVLLPEVVQSAMRWLPFYYITYVPSMLMIGRSGEALAMGFVVLIAWIGVFALVNPLSYRVLRMRYEGVGV